MSFRLTRLSVARVQPTRLFSTTPAARKSIVDSAKEAVKTVDRTISNAAVKGIDKGIEVKDAAKETIASSDASAKLKEASGKAEELKGEAKGKAAELKGEAKGKINEVKGKM